MPYLLYHQEHEDAHNNNFHQGKCHHQRQFDHCFQCNNHRLPKNHPITTVIQILWIIRYLTLLLCIYSYNRDITITIYHHKVYYYDYVTTTTVCDKLTCLLLRVTACNAKCVFATTEASIRLSVTLLYCVKTTQLRIMKSSLWATARSFFVTNFCAAG